MLQWVIKIKKAWWGTNITGIYSTYHANNLNGTDLRIDTNGKLAIVSKGGGQSNLSASSIKDNDTIAVVYTKTNAKLYINGVNVNI